MYLLEYRPCVKGKFSFLCFVHWWIIKIDLNDLIWLIDWFVLCFLFVSRDAGVWRRAGWRGGGGVWGEAASMWLPHHVHRHHPQPGAEEWWRHRRRPPQTQQQGEARWRWWQLGVTVVVGVVVNGILLPWKMALTVVVGVVFNLCYCLRKWPWQWLWGLYSTAWYCPGKWPWRWLWWLYWIVFCCHGDFTELCFICFEKLPWQWSWWF